MYTLYDIETITDYREFEIAMKKANTRHESFEYVQDIEFIFDGCTYNSGYVSVTFY